MAVLEMLVYGDQCFRGRKLSPGGSTIVKTTWGKQKQNIFFETFYSQFLKAIFLALGTLFSSLFALKMG